MTASRIRTPETRPLNISLTFVAAATAWVVVTDWGLEPLLNPAHSLSWSLGKDLLFVAVTTLVLFRSLRTQTGASRQLRHESQSPRLGDDQVSVSTELEATRRKRAIATLIDSERQFRSLTRNLPAVVYQLRVTAGKAYRFDYLSSKAEKIFGVRPSLQGTDWRDLSALVHPDDRPAFLDSANTAITGRVDWEFEGRLAGHEDEPRWLSGLSSLVVDGDDLLFHGVFLDITSRKRIEEQLCKLSLAVEHSPVSVVITDSEGSIEYVNPKFTDLTGYTLEEARGQNPRILKSGYTPNHVYQQLWERVTAGQSWHGEFRNKKKNGEFYWESASISPVLNEQGVATHFVAVKENITERKRAELALRRSQQRFQRALENIPDIVVIYDRNLRIQYINAAAHRLTGLPASSFIGRRSDEIWPPEVCEAYIPTLRDAFESGELQLGGDRSLLPWSKAMQPPDHLCAHDRRQGQRLGSPGHHPRSHRAQGPRTGDRKAEPAVRDVVRAQPVHCAQSSREQELFREVCRITVAHAGFKLVWVGWHDRETHEVRPVGRAGDSAGYLDKIEVYADDRPEGGGPVGICIRSGKPCIVESFVHDPRAAPWREAAVAHGLLSVAALPIEVNGEACGAFVVYAGEKGVFQDKEVALLQEVAATISFALNHLEDEKKRRQAEDSLREREAQYRAVIETSADGFTMIDGEGRFLEVNDAYVRRSGYSRDELMNMSFFDVLAHGRPLDLEDRLALIRREGSALFENLHRSKDGTLWPAEVNVAYWPHAGGRFLSFVRDVHRRNRSESLLRTRLELSHLVSHGSLDELLQTALDTAELYTGSRVGYLHFVDAEQQGLALEARSTGTIGSRGPDEARLQPLPISQAGAWADCYHTHVPVIHNDFMNRSQAGLPECSTPIVRYLSVPIIRHDQVAAILGVGNKTSDYDQGDVQVLHELATMVMEIVERKQAEIRMSLLVTALEASASAIVITGPDGTIEWANPAFSHLSGYSLKDAVGRRRADLGGSGVQSREFTEALSQTSLGGRVWRGELINERKDGSIYYEEMTMTPVADEAGNIRHFVAVEQDITERKKSEEAMRQRIELQEQFARVAASVPGVVYSFRLRPDRTTSIPFAVPAIEELFGISRDVLATDATSLIENIHPDDRQQVVQNIEEASRLPSPWHGVYRYIHPDEGERWVEGWSAPQVEVDGSILWHGFLMDVSARKRAEEEIQSLNVSLERRVAERTAELESMLANATIGLAFFDRDIRFTRINHCLAQMNGIPVADHIGRSLREVLPTVAEAVEPMVRQVFDTSRPLAEMELESSSAAYPEERRFWLHSLFAVPGPDGTVISVGAAVADITEQKRAQQELAAANHDLAGAARLKDEFLASMSHELRTPLNGILGMSEGLQEQVYGPLNSKQLTALRDVEECGRHLLALINDILDIAKIEAGKVELELAPVTVEDMCQASLRLVRESALKKKITVSLHLDRLVRVLTADERRLKQVLVNLLSNAVKFTAETGRVGLDVVGEEDKGQVRFSVWDTGIGMRPEELQRLFQPFVQLDSRLSRQYEGTGLGLALVKRLTELHGGRVQVDSQPGKGSRFTVVLPWTAQQTLPTAYDSWDGQQERSSLHDSPPGAVGGALILAVDDNPGNARGMVDYLTFKGFRVVFVTSGSRRSKWPTSCTPTLSSWIFRCERWTGWKPSVESASRQD